MYCRLVILIAAAWWCVFPVQAQSECESASEQCVVIGQWEFKLAVGAGFKSNPVAGGDNIPLVLVPQLSYYGERFFIENLEMGYTLYSTSSFMINTILTPARDGAFFARADINNYFIDGLVSRVSDSLITTGDPAAKQIVVENLHKRRLSGMAGLEVSGALADIEWQVQWLNDVTAVHDGQAVRFAARRGFTLGAQTIQATLGFNWKSASMHDYYYGISYQEAGNTPLAYQADSGFSPFVTVGWQKKINKKWALVGAFQYEQLSREISDSPIIEEQRVLQGFVGGAYHF